MSTVREIIRGYVEDVYGDFGIEIECEGKGIIEVHSKYWTTVNDGSLRGQYLEECAEYVSKLQLDTNGKRTALKRTHHKVHPALRSLFRLHLKDAVFNKSPRTSTHVHINVLDLTRKELFNFIYLLTLLEDSLIKLSGKSRQGNRFCLSSKDAVGYFKGVSYLFDVPVRRLRLSEEDFKYSTINLATIGKYGTVEIRCMEGTNDAVRLTRWINLLLSIRDLSKQYVNAYQIMEDLDKFKESKIQSLIKDFPELLGTDIENNILYSISYNCEFPEYYKEIPEKEKEVKVDILKHKYIKPGDNVAYFVPDFIRADDRANVAANPARRIIFDDLIQARDILNDLA